eukprot:g21928.t1
MSDEPTKLSPAEFLEQLRNNGGGGGMPQSSEDSSTGLLDSLDLSDLNEPATQTDVEDGIDSTTEFDDISGAMTESCASIDDDDIGLDFDDVDEHDEVSAEEEPASAPGPGQLSDLFNRVSDLLGGSDSDTDGPFRPKEPESLAETGLSSEEVERLILKFLLQKGSASGRAICSQVCLPFNLVDPVLKELKQEQLLAFKGAAQIGDYEFTITDSGRDRARKYAAECTYFGAAPVSLRDYLRAMEAQSISKQEVSEEDLTSAFSDLIINTRMLERLGPAINSGRGMFLFGEPGNGKTSIAERVTRCFGSTIWIPKALGIDGDIIRVYDPGVHEVIEDSQSEGIFNLSGVDARWIQVERPTVIAGGELTMSELEVAQNRETKICEAPLQLKSNCGTLVIDDFGRQTMPVDVLLNRWIVPLEKRYDFLNLPSGKKIQVPFDQLIVFSTNLEPKDLVDGAFLRRIPYKIEVIDPSEAEFLALFELMAPLLGFQYDDECVRYLIDTHYLPHSRPFRACQPRDLLAQANDGQAPRDLTSDLSVRAGVGYGGGDFTVHGGVVYFVVHKEGRLYRQQLSGGAAVPITPEFGSASSPVVSPDGRWVVYVHHDGQQTDVIAVVDSEGTMWPQILAGGHDFYMQPRISADGKRVAWISWDHPNMPWDGSTLYVADVIENSRGLPSLDKPRAIAGGSDVSIFQSEFTPDGRTIVYSSDESGWGRLCATDLESGKSRWLTPNGVEHGWPAWVQDMRTYAMAHDGSHVIAARSENGFQRLLRIELETGDEQPIDQLADYTEISQIQSAPDSQRIVIVGSGSTTPKRIVVHDCESGQTTVVARSSGETVSQSGLSQCEAVSWETAGGETAHGLYYAPASDRFQSNSGKPPVIAHIHGGPTSQATSGWNANAQFFATRGYGVLLVNYRGSTGYGREYMLRLRENWGVCDVEDAISGVRFLADAGRVDPDKTIVMGGSAGGFTVLQSLSQFPESFTAGVSLYGVANQFHLAAETHKFEARYTDTLVGPLPEASAVYHARSPEFHAERIVRPLAIYQGEIDRVVPKAQSDAIAAAMKRNGTPHIYHCYEGEGHGWRKSETIEHFYNSVDEFLRRHVIFA